MPRAMAQEDEVRFFSGRGKLPNHLSQMHGQIEKRGLATSAIGPHVIWLSAFSIFLSVLYCPSPYTAQMVAGNQPMIVSWRTRQITPAIGLPMVKNVSQGRIKAISKRTFLSKIVGRSFNPLEQVRLCQLTPIILPINFEQR